MANVEHSGLTGSDLHEPKGVSTANSGEVYVANGSGTGAWTPGNNFNKVVLNCTLPDIDTDAAAWVVCPFNGDITSISAVIDGAIATADAVITTKIAGVAVTGGGITITQSGSTAGDTHTVTPTALNTVVAGQEIELENNLAATNAVTVTFTLVIDVNP